MKMLTKGLIWNNVTYIMFGKIILNLKVSIDEKQVNFQAIKMRIRESPLLKKLLKQHFRVTYCDSLHESIYIYNTNVKRSCDSLIQ